MCENCSSNHHFLFNRNRRSSHKSAMEGDLEDREYAFGLLGTIKLETPEVHEFKKSLWDQGLYDPHKYFRQKYKSLDYYPKKPAEQDHQHFSL